MFRFFVTMRKKHILLVDLGHEEKENAGVISCVMLRQVSI